MVDTTLTRLANNLAGAILQRAKDHCDCYGTYCLIVQGSPEIPKPTTADGKRLIDAARLYIDLNGTKDAADPDTLLVQERGCISIRKRTRLSGSRVELEFR